ncbi:MAG: YhjD/YihY/BrkB family envelope integrity protein [FCB group bacterium]
MLWLSSTLLSSLRTGLNNIFHIKTPKIFFIYKLKDILQIIALALLVLLASFIFPIISITVHHIQHLIPHSLKFISSWLYLTMISITTSFLLFYYIFSYVPNRKMPTFIRVMSTFLCIVFLEISRYVFAWYISGVTSYGRFYGTYAILASIAVWVFYFTMIILFSAEFSQLIYDIKYRDKN